MDIFNEKGKTGRKIKGRKLQTNILYNLLHLGNALANSSVVARKSLIAKVGGLSESKDLRAVEDFDLWLKLSEITERFSYINKTLGGYWVSANNTSKPSAALANRTIFLLEQYLDRIASNQRRAVIAYMNYAESRIIVRADRISLKELIKKFLSVVRDSPSLEIKFRALVNVFVLLFGVVKARSMRA